tara:strand:- start:47 stop:643 length:597 start_codon:yes stop_codon:yes gene_type:complete
MEEYQLFPATVWSVDLNLDLDHMRKEIREFSSTHPTEHRSNDGGYQGHCFDYQPLFDGIKENIPQYEDPELGELYISTWVNINRRGNRNRRHTHSDGINFLSGVFWVTIPKESGDIRFFDPKPPVYYSMADLRYYQLSQAAHTETISPKENRLLLFPCWLEHEVDPSFSDEDRISVSFNIVRKIDAERYQEFVTFRTV